MEINEMMCPAGGVVIKPKKESLSAGHACLWLPTHQIFVECEPDEAIFQYAMNNLMETFTSAILNENPILKRKRRKFYLLQTSYMHIPL